MTEQNCGNCEHSYQITPSDNGVIICALDNKPYPISESCEHFICVNE